MPLTSFINWANFLLSTRQRECNCTDAGVQGLCGEAAAAIHGPGGFQHLTLTQQRHIQEQGESHTSNYSSVADPDP
jgi:hypothetical protein